MKKAAEQHVDSELISALLRARRLVQPDRVSADLRTVTYEGGRDADVFYRDRWSHDRIVRSTHGVNCTGSCSWKVYVKDGIITWETQETDYPTVGADSPEYEPRGCPRGRPSPGTPTHRRGSGSRTCVACFWRCIARRAGGSATPCWRGPT